MKIKKTEAPFNCYRTMVDDILIFASLDTLSEINIVKTIECMSRNRPTVSISCDRLYFIQLFKLHFKLKKRANILSSFNNINDTTRSLR